MAAPLGNIFALGNEGGRKPMYDSVDDLRDKIIEYFESYLSKNEEDNEPVLGYKPTITGLALYLGFSSRQSFYDYVKKKEFSYILKKASLYIEMNYEMLLESKSSTGAIFALKNMGWKDKQEVTSTVTNLTPPTEEELKAANDKLDDLM